MSAPKLTGAKSQCTACGEFFISVEAFDHHRVGRFGHERRCLTQREMDDAGFTRDCDGYRHKPERGLKPAVVAETGARAPLAMVLQGGAP